MTRTYAEYAVVPATITPGARVMTDGTLRYPAPDGADSTASGE